MSRRYLTNQLSRMFTNSETLPLNSAEHTTKCGGGRVIKPANELCSIKWAKRSTASPSSRYPPTHLPCHILYESRLVYICRPMSALGVETAVSVLASPGPGKLPDSWQVLRVASTWNDGQTLIVPFKASIVSDIRKWPPFPLPEEGLCSQTHWHFCSQAWSFPVMRTDAARCSLRLLLHTLPSSILASRLA